MNLVCALRAFLAVSIVVSGSPSSAKPDCRDGARNVRIALLLPSGGVWPLSVASDYFDQRFIPADLGSRDGLLLRMQATDFSPWPRGIRPHISEGPFMSYLLTNYLPFEEVADRAARQESGHNIFGTVEITRTPGPFGLTVLTVPPPKGKYYAGPLEEHDVYVAVDGQGSTTDIIRCSRPGLTPYQLCEHMIETGEMDINLAYAPEFLSDWARLSAGAIEFLDCMKGK